MESLHIIPREGGAEMLHNAIKYAYNASDSLENSLFYKAEDTEKLKGAFDAIFNLITEKVGFTNVVVKDGIATGVTSSTVVNGDVSGFTYMIRDNTGALAYKVTVAPNGVPEGTTAEDGKPLFWFSENGPPVVGEVRSVPTTKILTDTNGDPILDENDEIQTVDVNVDVYYYKENPDNPDSKEYIMPIATTGANVVWDLSPLGVLKDGYKYEVDFVVWPKQDAYDLVADLNNGKRTDLEEDANWDDKEILTDSDGKEYRIGGFEDYPYIARYEDGIYSAMSNTNQSVEFYKVDKKIEDGEEVTVYTRPDPVTVDPPGPMPLTASMSQIEKQWNVDRNPAVLTELLYGNKDPDSGEWIPFSITFGVYIDDPPEESTDDPNDPTDPTEEPTDPNDPTDPTEEPTDPNDPTNPEDDQTVIEPYKSVTLGWQSDWDKETDDYEWLDAPEENNVTYGGKDHKVGTRWAQEFSIATGLMLSEDQMEIEGLNKSLYSSFEYDHVRYYILEPGHDYRLEESPKMGYEFDYSAPVYHPMLVDNVLRSVTFTRDTAGKITGISEMTSADVNMSSLKVENTLRGYINLKKVVVDKNNNPRPTDDTKFAYHISLVNPSPVFDGDHIPWYGVNDLYYHDEDFNYFHAYVDEHNQLKICTESGGRENPYDAVIGTIDSETEEFVAGGTFDPNNVTGQVLRFEDESGERIVTIKGNRSNAADDARSSWADMMIGQNERLSIANVPLGTKYTITETQTDGYDLVSIASNQIQNSKAAINISGYEIEGNIIQNADNDVTYTNKVIDGSLQITKNVTVDNEPTETDWADGEYSFVITDANGKPAIGMVNGQWIGEDGRVSITITNGESDSITVTGLRIGEYTITEEEPDNGTILAAFTVNGASKTVENGVVADDDKKVMVLENQNTTASFTNNINTTAVEVQKVWTDDGQEGVDHTGQTISYKIYRIPYEMMDDPENEGVRIRGVSYPVQEVTADLLPDLHNNGFTGILQYNSQNSAKSWKERVSKLPRAGKYIPVGETEAVQVFYEYYVTEETEIPGYKTSIEGSTITEGENQGTYSYIITNEPLGPTDQETQINVRKEWKTADGAADEDLHKADSILLNVTQKKYEAKVLIGTGDQAEPKMLYPITINLSDKNGNNNNPRVNHTYVVYVPEGAEFTMEPHWVVNGSNPQEHTVYVYGNGITVTPRSQSPSTTTYADKPGRTYYYPGATFTIEEVDSAKEITLELHAGNDKWMDLYDMYHSSEEPSYEDRHQWTCEMTSSYEIIWDLEEMLDNVLQGADGPAHTDPVLVNTSHPSYTMALTNNETGLPTVINNGENAPGHGEGSADYTWEGSIKHLPLYEYKDSGDDAGKSFIYTYELIETAIGSDTVNTVNPPGESGEWNGQTTSYFVKWDQDTQTGSWTLTNQKKPPAELTLYKVSENNFPNTSSLLEGAAFKLIKYTSLSPKAKDMKWGNDGESAVVSDNPQNPGIFHFENLDAGYYEIVETTYPDGYVQITENPVFQVRYLKESAEPEILLVYGSGEQIGQPITGNATDIVKIENGTVVFGNIPGAALPNSGGPGTKLFTIFGAMLLFLAAAGMAVMKTGLIKRRL